MKIFLKVINRLVFPFYIGWLFATKDFKWGWIGSYESTPLLAVIAMGLSIIAYEVNYYTKAFIPLTYV